MRAGKIFKIQGDREEKLSKKGLEIGREWKKREKTQGKNLRKENYYCYYYYCC